MFVVENLLEIDVVPDWPEGPDGYIKQAGVTIILFFSFYAAHPLTRFYSLTLFTPFSQNALHLNIASLATRYAWFHSSLFSYGRLPFHV